MGKEIVRVLRVLEYVGEREWVEDTLKRGNVPANGIIDTGKGCVIKSAIIDQFPEILDNKETQHENEQSKYEDRERLS